MLTKKEIAFIRSLSKPNIRREEKLFVAEGYKSVVDLLPYFKCVYLIADKDNYNALLSSDKYSNRIEKNINNNIIHIVDNKFDFGKISGLKNPQSILAVFAYPERKKTYKLERKKTYLFLDDIQDPGNMGTIIRTADWFAIDTIFMTKGCADIYNNKVVQSTMGSLGRINAIEIDNTNDFFQNIDADIFGTFLENSQNIHEINNITDKPIILVMGNEGNGISNEVAKYVNRRITIPLSPNRIDDNKPDSLNVSIATAIALFKLSSIY